MVWTFQGVVLLLNFICRDYALLKGLGSCEQESISLGIDPARLGIIIATSFAEVFDTCFCPDSLGKQFYISSRFRQRG